MSGRVPRVGGVGIPFTVAAADLLAQVAAIVATTLYAVPASGAGLYRLSWAAKITTAALASSVLGGAAGFQSTYTDSDDSVVTTPLAVPNALATGNTTGVQLSGAVLVNAKAGTNLQYSFDYTSVGTPAMAYALHLVLEYLG